MSKQFLDLEGLKHFWDKVKSYIETYTKPVELSRSYKYQRKESSSLDVPFWIYFAKSPAGDVLYKIINTNNELKVYSTVDGVTWNLIGARTMTGIRYGDSVVGSTWMQMGTTSNSRTYETIHYSAFLSDSDPQYGMLTYDIQNKLFGYVEKSPLTNTSGDTVIPFGNIMFYKGQYYFLSYWRKNNTFGKDGIWRGLTLHKFNKSISDATVVTELFNFYNAPGTPSSVNSTAVFVNEPYSTNIGNHVFTVARAVGNVKNQYNTGFYLYHWDLDSPQTVGYSDFAGTSQSSSSSKGARWINTSSWTGGGHYNGVIPRITHFFKNGKLYLFISLYVRNSNTGTEVSGLYYTTMPIDDIKNCDSVIRSYDFSQQKWHLLTDSRIFKTGQTTSPEGGNHCTSNINNRVVIGCTNSSKGTAVIDISLDVQDIITD